MEPRIAPAGHDECDQKVVQLVVIAGIWRRLTANARNGLRVERSEVARFHRKAAPQRDRPALRRSSSGASSRTVYGRPLTISCASGGRLNGVAEADLDFLTLRIRATSSRRGVDVHHLVRQSYIVWLTSG